MSAPAKQIYNARRRAWRASPAMAHSASRHAGDSAPAPRCQLSAEAERGAPSTELGPPGLDQVKEQKKGMETIMRNGVIVGESK